jgi:DNA-binding MarR family transcriptional regulator
VTQARDQARDRDPAAEGDKASERDSAGDETLAEAFWSVARQLRETSAKTLAPWDINPSQLRALRVLTRRGTMRLSQLSEHLHIAPRSATEATEDGLGVLEAIRGTEAGRVFGRLSQADRAHLARILRQLRDLPDRNGRGGLLWRCVSG